MIDCALRSHSAGRLQYRVFEQPAVVFIADTALTQLSARANWKHSKLTGRPAGWLDANPFCGTSFSFAIRAAEHWSRPQVRGK